MTRRQVQQISNPEPIEIILQHQQTSDQQQALIEQLQARVGKLEAQIKRLDGPSTDGLNSSVPPTINELTGLLQSDSCKKNHT